MMPLFGMNFSQQTRDILLILCAAYNNVEITLNSHFLQLLLAKMTSILKTVF